LNVCIIIACSKYFGNESEHTHPQNSDGDEDDDFCFGFLVAFLFWLRAVD
jgi:hypothetical protein